MILALLSTSLADKPKPTPPPTPVKTAPLRYFEDRCSRCHGPNGSFYGDQFGKSLTEAALRKVVDDMCRVQADAPLLGQDLEAQIAFHRALIAKEPFLAVTRMSDQELAGEVTEKATVSVRFDRSIVFAEVKGTTWKAAVPKGVKPADAVVVGLLDRRATAVRLTRETYSHGPPHSPIPAQKRPHQ